MITQPERHADDWCTGWKDGRRCVWNSDADLSVNDPTPICVLRDSDYGDNAEAERIDADAELIAVAPAMLEFVIQYLYSEHNICAPTDNACPYSPTELKYMAIRALAQAKGDNPPDCPTGWEIHREEFSRIEAIADNS